MTEIALRASDGQGTQGTGMIPGTWLESLALHVIPTGAEWRVAILVLTVLTAPGPVSARQVAKRLGLAYSPVKRAVRGLLAWNILQRSPEGVRFQPDATRWGPPGSPGRKDGP